MTFWVAGAALVGGIGGAILSGDAAEDAAYQQAGAAGLATAEQRRQFDILQQNQAPYRAIGENALARLTNLLNNGKLTSRFAGNAANEPGYQFGMREGRRAVDNSASARGGIGGAALKAGIRYANDYATTKYNDAFNRWNTENNAIYNRLAGISGLGQTATQNVGQAGQNYANAFGENVVGAANAGAAARVAQGNIYGNVLGQIGAMAGRQWGGGSGYQPYTTPDEYWYIGP